MLEETLYQPQSLVSAKANIYKIKLVSPKIISLIKLFQSLKWQTIRKKKDFEGFSGKY